MVSEEQVKKILYEWDPTWLAAFPISAPPDEYDSEAEIIYKKLSKIKNPDQEQVKKIIRTVIDYYLGDAEGAHKTKELDEISLKILGKSEKHLCPVCREYWFECPGSYDVCPVCNWEDDKLQNDNPDYEGGANHLSVHETQALRYLLQRDETREEVSKMYEYYLDQCIALTNKPDPEVFHKMTKKFCDELLNVYCRNFVTPGSEM